SSDKKDIVELQKALSDLIQHVGNYDTNFEIKANAYGELQQIREHLDNLEDASPETKDKLRKLLSRVRDGSSDAMKLGTEIKDAYELVDTLPKLAATVMALLAAIPM
ncbi:MAG: hypothetical protein KAH22_05985, partial [Thiotrichaceae bacterium]|nr:hypothetical protein [Thiotrichaceae bacterium]